MGNKLGRLVTYHEALLLMLLHSLVTWSVETTSQSKTIIYQLPKHLLLQNLAGL